MTRNELLKRLKRYARRNGLRLEVSNEGKGSHQRVYLDGQSTFVPYGEIKPRTFLGILKQLEVNREDF